MPAIQAITAMTWNALIHVIGFSAETSAWRSCHGAGAESRRADAAGRAAHRCLAASARVTRLGEPVDECGMRAARSARGVIGHARILAPAGHIRCPARPAFRNARDKRDRRHDHTLALRAGAADFGIGRRPDPFERTDPALIADLPVEIRRSPSAPQSPRPFARPAIDRDRPSRSCAWASHAPTAAGDRKR